MATIVTRASKGTTLSWAEMDANLTNLNNKVIEVISVKDFGAVGDGVTDDTAAIQTALNSGAGLVSIPPGDYKVTSTLLIPPNTHLNGAFGQSIKYNPSNAVCKISYSGTDLTAVKFVCDVNGAVSSKLSDVVVRQLAGGAANVIAIQVGDATDIPTYALSTFIENVHIFGFTGKGVYNYGSWNCSLTNVMVHGASPSARTNIGFHFDNTDAGATSCCLINCFAEECVVGFEIGSLSSSGRAYSYSSLINTYVDGCTSGYRFLGSGTSRVIQVFNAGVEVVDGGNAVYASGCAVNFNGLSMFANGTGFTYVIEADNSAVLTINDGDFIPGTGFSTASTAIVKADNAVIRFINTRLTNVSAERLESNGGRIDVITYDQDLYNHLERTNNNVIDVTISNRNSTFSGYTQYIVSTSAGANQAMAGQPIIDVTNVNDGEVITFVNKDLTYDIVLRTEDIVAGTGIIKHPSNASGSGVVLSARDIANFVKTNGKLYELRRGV